MFQKSMFGAGFLSLLCSLSAQGADTSSTIHINLKTSLGTCADVATACGKLYGDIFTATVKPIQDSCTQVAAECGAGLCRHKVDMKIVEELKASIDPKIDYVDGQLTAHVTASFNFTHSKSSEISCQWPGTYEDVRFVTKEAWTSSHCTAIVTRICDHL